MDDPVTRHIHALRDPDPEVRWKGAYYFMHSPSPLALESLLFALNDPVPEVRGEVAVALGASRDTRAVLQLITALRMPFGFPCLRPLPWSASDNRALEPVLEAFARGSRFP